MGDFDNRVAFITGAAHGQGRATALALAKNGADIAAFDVVKRINVDPNEARKSAWEKALELLDRVAKGEYIPASWSPEETPEDDTSSNKATPFFGDSRRRFILNETL